MSIDDKQSISWVYELNKEQLIAHIEKRELPITGNLAVLRQRLLSVVRLTLNPQDPLSPLTEESPPTDPLNKNPEKDRVNTASQTEIDFSYFNLIDNLISIGKLPSYSQYMKDKQSHRSVDENAQARPKYGESYHVSQNQDRTRVVVPDHELENQQRGTYNNNYNINPELHSGRFTPNRRSFHSYTTRSINYCKL